MLLLLPFLCVLHLWGTLDTQSKTLRMTNRLHVLLLASRGLKEGASPIFPSSPSLPPSPSQIDTCPLSTLPVSDRYLSSLYPCPLLRAIVSPLLTLTLGGDQSSQNPPHHITVFLLQWNCHGVCTNYEKLLPLLQDYNTLCVCLQEHILGSRPLPSSFY